MAMGENCVMLRKPEQQPEWWRMDNVGQYFDTVWAASPLNGEEGWAVGGNGTILHYNRLVR